MRTVTYADVAKSCLEALEQGRLQAIETVYDPHTDYPACMYRSEVEGKTVVCAVGSHITDEEYIPDYEDNSFLGLLHDCHLLWSVSDLDENRIKYLQSAHDTLTTSAINKEDKVRLMKLAIQLFEADRVEKAHYEWWDIYHATAGN